METRLAGPTCPGPSFLELEGRGRLRAAVAGVPQKLDIETGINPSDTASSGFAGDR